jgi:DNA modification methylase
VTAIITQGDARALPLPDESVDLVVTSPPYFGLRDYQDGNASLDGQVGAEATPREYVAALLECTREWARVLKPSGSIFVNLGDRYSQRSAARRSSHQDGLFPGRPELRKDWKRDRAAGLARMPYENIAGAGGGHVPEKSLIGLPWRYALGCIDDLGLILRAEIIWAKPNGLPESVRDRVRRSHEQVFHFVRQPRYYTAIDEIREPHIAVTAGRDMTGWRHGPSGNREIGRGQFGAGIRDFATSPLGKLPGSVWDIATQPLKAPDRLGVDHFAAFPMELPRRCILGWSPPGGVVLDPFGGTGTTALVADVLGRTGISVDRSADYCRLALWRANDPRERAKAGRRMSSPARRRGRADPQEPLSLF